MKRNFSLLKNQRFDLLICGGGIYGAWTAYDASLRGLKVAIIEQGDWACATSSSSSKLIHGGLRYLESFDFKLVKKALSERQMLLQSAPHRVWPLRFGVPVYADSRVGRLSLKIGLMLYDFLAATPLGIMAHQYFNREEFSRRFSFLSTLALKGGFTYNDAQTDDARLVLELISGAIEAGAVCVNYCKLEGLTEKNGQACGVTVLDLLCNKTLEVEAKQIVYTIGQWLTTDKEISQSCRVTKGVHLIMPSTLTDEALLLTAKSDGRVFFLIPWYEFTILGTTDNDYLGDIKNVQVENSDIEYLLKAVNHYLKSEWTVDDVIASYAGLRVMKNSDKSSPSAVSRDWELKTAGNGVHYSIGGKITSAREDATGIVDRVCSLLGLKLACVSRGKLFPWTPEENYATWLTFTGAQAEKLHVDTESTKWLIRRHGKRVNDILNSIEATPLLASRITPAVPLIFADLLFCAKNEMVVHLFDLLRRRMPLLLLTRLTQEELRSIVQRVASIMEWDDNTIQVELADCARHMT